MADRALFDTRSRRSGSDATSDSSSARLSEGWTFSTQMTDRPPASSSQSSEYVRMRSMRPSAMRNNTAMRSEPSSLTGPWLAGARRRSVSFGSIPQTAGAQPDESDITMLPDMKPDPVE